MMYHTAKGISNIDKEKVKNKNKINFYWKPTYSKTNTQIHYQYTANLTNNKPNNNYNLVNGKLLSANQN